MIPSKVLLWALVVWVCFCSYSNADQTSNLLNNQNWTGNYQSCSGSACYGGTSGGHIPNFNGSIFRWGYGGGVINQTIAINQALQASGIEVDGYSYHWHVKNQNAGNPYQGGSQDPLVVTIDVYKANGDLYQSYEYDYSYSMDWTHFAGTQYFPDNGLDPSFFGNLNLSVEGDDAGYWAGYYGPEFYPLSLTLIYSANPCASDPLSDPSCPGYAEAYAEYLYQQNCTANPLYDSGCPGYQTAFYNQQCNANPLYDTGCPGYAEAYFSQQCTANPLYDEACPGYADAYLNQQCDLDVFYDASCPGYEQAYFEKYVKPNIDTGVEDVTEVVTAETTVEPVTDPLEELLSVSVTGDATVDEVLGDTVDVTSMDIGMDSSFDLDVPEIETDIAESEVVEEPQTEETIEEIEIASLDAEGDDNAETEVESSSDVDEQLEEGGNEEGGDSGQDSEGSSDDDSSGKSESGKSNSKSDKEKKKREKIKKAIADKAKNLANDMANAATIEAQKAVQAQVLALINYVPDFGRYGGNITGGYYPDTGGYPATELPENRKGLRNGLAQQLLHEKMVDMQYERD